MHVLIVPLCEPNSQDSRCSLELSFIKPFQNGVQLSCTINIVVLTEKKIKITVLILLY